MMVLGMIASLFGCASPDKTPVDPLENDTIVYFSLSEGGGMARFSGFSYSIKETKDGKVHFLFNEGYPDEKEFTLDDHSVFDSLQQIIVKHKMYTYCGDYRPPFDITDGGSWSLYVKYASKKTISAGGYMAGPDGYGAAFNDIHQCLKQWKEMPFPVPEVVAFRYEYGKETYVIVPEDDHATLIYNNEETGEHKELQRELDILEDLRITFNIGRLKMNNTRRDLEEGCTPWMYDIAYSNGEHYRYESYDRDYRCGYTEMLQGFFYNWMQEAGERRRLDYYY